MLPLGLSLPMMQTQWKSQIDPLLTNPLNDIQILQDVALASGSNVINHKLGRKMQGWFLTDIQGSQTVYRSAPFNNLTLTLTASGAVTVNIGVF